MHDARASALWTSRCIRYRIDGNTPPDPVAGRGHFGVVVSAVDNEPPLRWQRAVHLAPAAGLGVARRAIFFAVLSWLPLAVWALLQGRFFATGSGESLLQHFGVNVRCLVAIRC
jgi:hypothetical protein